MIILTKDNLESNEQITNIIEEEKQLIMSTIESQKALKSILLDYMQKLADSTDNVSINHSDTILNILQDSKETLNLFQINKDLLNNLLKLLDNVALEFRNKERNIDFETINHFNKDFFDANKTISRNTMLIEIFLQSTLQFSKFKFDNTDDNSINNTAFPDEAKEDKIIETPVNKNLVQPVGDTDIIENTLIISETKGKVFLPYTISSLDDTLKNNSDKYSSIEDIINKKYTLPFGLFKNPAIARFREGFNLMRKKEKKSIRNAFDLGMELLFNYNLHPAIITACKNLDELDAYLEYLENNETHKFDYFKIIFDIAPVSLGKNKRS